MTAVTVIIPTYNRADVLPRAVESVLEQTYEDLELCVVDDGSTDQTAACLDRFDDPRMEAITHETNQGANAARNTGIDSADGEYVAFLDSDDEWKPTKLERQLQRVERDDEEWVGAYCDAEMAAEGVTGGLRGTAAAYLERLDDAGVQEGGEELAGELLAGNVYTAAGSTFLVRTDVARGVGGFDENLDRFQDPEFVLRIIEHGPVAYVDEPLVVRYDTGAPSAERVSAASDEYRAKHADTVATAEAQGYDVTGAHNLVVAKQFLSEGSVARGVANLRRATVELRHVPGLLSASLAGVRRRWSLGLTAILVGVLLLLVARRRR